MGGHLHPLCCLPCCVEAYMWTQTCHLMYLSDDGGPLLNRGCKTSTCSAQGWSGSTSASSASLARLSAFLSAAVCWRFAGADCVNMLSPATGTPIWHMTAGEVFVALLMFWAAMLKMQCPLHSCDKLGKE